MDNGIIEKEIEESREKIENKNIIINKSNKGKNLKKFIKILCIIIVSFIVGYIARVIDVHKTGNETVTINELGGKLKQIEELATYSYEYTDEKKESNAREIFGFAIPGTTNTVDIIFSGVIKVGYKVSDINCQVDNVHKKIIVTLPKPQVLDNYIKLNDLQCKEDNNILNPIGTDDIIRYFEEMEKYELDKAEEKGIYDEAEKHVKTIIKNCFAQFEYYEVEFE